MRTSAFVGIACAALLAGAAAAQEYTWTDERGGVHFADELGEVPARFRAQAARDAEARSPRDESGPAALDPVPESARPHLDAKRGLKVTVPAGWEVEELGKSKVLAVYASTEEAGWQANVALSVKPAAGWKPEHFDQFAGVLLKSFSNSERFALKRRGKVTHPSGAVAHELVYTYVRQGIPLTDRVVIVPLPSDRVLVATASSVTSLWSKYQPQLDAVIDSVRASR